MVRVTSVPASKARRKTKLKLAKGFRGRNKNLNRVTSGVVKRSLANRFVGRKLRKRDIRSLWITRIAIATENQGISYSCFMNGLKKSNILLNRKILSDLATSHETVFSHLVQVAKKAIVS